MCCLQETLLLLRHTQIESEEMEKDIQCKWKPKKTVVSMLISDKTDFKTKSVIRDKAII